MGLILADTLVAWRDSLKSSEALLQPISFTYDPAVYSLDMWPRSILSIRISSAPIASYAVVPWEATETVQIVADTQDAVAFGDTIHALVRNMKGHVYLTDSCQVWQCLLAGEPQLSLVGSAREAILNWHGTASWRL